MTTRVDATYDGRSPSAAPTPSLRRLGGGPDARIRLVCFAYAGAGGYVYRRWVGHLPPDIDICAVQLPGREDRFREPLPHDIDLVIDHLVDELSGYLDGPYAIFGHSLGAVIGTEVVRRLVEEGGVPPAHLFVSGSRALPEIHEGRRRVHLLADDELLDHVLTLNGTPTELLDDPRMQGFVLQLIRADYTMFDTYRHRPGTELSCPVTVFAGDDDPHTEGHDLRRWSAISSGRTEIISLPGDHFFLHSAQEQLLSMLADRLAVTPR